MRERVGRYRVTSVLGEGGMGIVYAALDDRLQRTIAVKTLRGSNESAGSRARLEREARAAASVNHPAICQLFELGEEDGELFIAMELLEGESLATRGRYHLARFLALAGDSAGALDLLRAVVATGFFCLPAIVREPSLDSLRALPGFAPVLRDAETQHRRAIISFLTAEGDRVLGLSSPV